MSRSHIIVYSSQQPLLRTTSQTSKLLQFNHQLQTKHAMRAHCCFWPHEIKKKVFFVCYKNISHMFILPSHCRTLITWGHSIGFFQTPYLQFMLGDGISLKRLMSLQMCVTLTTRTRRAIPQSCWQPSPLWKQRRTCGLWKNSLAAGTWMPKLARWAHLLCFPSSCSCSQTQLWPAQVSTLHFLPLSTYSLAQPQVHVAAWQS